MFFQSHYFNLTDSSSNTSSHKSGLSPQAKVGIGVGVGLGCAFLITVAIIVWYFRRRLLRNSAPTVANRDSGAEAYVSPDIKEQHAMPPHNNQQKLPIAPVEAPVRELRHEAPATELRHELP